MTHSEIVAYLQEQSFAAGAASFWHGKQAQSDINYNAPFPQALLFLMPSKLRKGNVTVQCAMCFVGNDQHESGSAKSIAIVDAMDKLTQEFQTLLAEGEDMELVEEVMERAPVYRKGASIGTGYYVTFSLQTKMVC